MRCPEYKEATRTGGLSLFYFEAKHPMNYKLLPDEEKFIKQHQSSCGRESFYDDEMWSII